jgi:proteasome lid subunit RPN8/RPN11
LNISILKSELLKIQAHAEENFPEECCGALIGTSGPSQIIEARRVRNTNFGSRNRRYNIDPLEYMKIEEEVEEEGLEILGIYHSHPDHPSRPSEFDLNNALPNFSYLIYSIYNGEGKKLTSWRLTPSRQEFIEEQIKMVEEGN